MHSITINTGLDGFLLLDEITAIQPDTIQGIRRFKDHPVYLGIESLAQLGAMHVRYTMDFSCHAFLLKINQCRLPVEKRLSGTYLLTAVLENRSSRSFSYHVAARNETAVYLDGSFLFAAMDYDASFQKERLQTHYRKIFSCLHSVSKNG